MQEVKIPCEMCRTYGATDEDCENCNGTGQLEDQNQKYNILVCNLCIGNGNVRKKCPQCDGKGYNIFMEKTREDVSYREVYRCLKCNDLHFKGIGWEQPFFRLHLRFQSKEGIIKQKKQ